MVHRAICRLSGGRIGLWPPKPDRWGTLRLTTVGRRSGKERTAIIGYLEDGPNLVALAMDGWADPEPASRRSGPCSFPRRDNERYFANGRLTFDDHSQGAMTMKLTATMMLSVDGVYQGPGGPDEDRRGGFDRGGWVAPHFDEEGGRFVTSVFERADALLLGRRTWQIFEAYWPHHDQGDPISHGINILPKYVPSTTLKDPGWNTHVIEGDVEAAVRELKARPGRELQVHGSGALLRWLLERDLVDELNLELIPVVVGEGLRLFPERGQTHDLELVESRTTPSGVTLQTYRPAGRATFGTVGE